MTCSGTPLWLLLVTLLKHGLLEARRPGSVWCSLLVLLDRSSRAGLEDAMRCWPTLTQLDLCECNHALQACHCFSAVEDTLFCA